MAPRKGPSSQPEVAEKNYPKYPKRPLEISRVLYELGEQAEKVDMNDKRGLKRLGERIVRLAPKEYMEAKIQDYKKKAWDIKGKYLHTSDDWADKEFDLNSYPPHSLFASGILVEALRAAGVENPKGYYQVLFDANEAIDDYLFVIKREWELTDGNPRPESVENGEKPSRDLSKEVWK
jgi:hypothetical protein